MPRPSTAEVNAILLEGDHREQVQVLKQLPDDVDAPLAARRLLALLENSGFWFARNLRKHTPSSVIRELLALLKAQLSSLEGNTHQCALLLIERMRIARQSDETEQDAWRAALQTILDIDTTYAWGSKQRKSKLRSLCENQSTVSALQAVAVGTGSPRLDVLVVLALEGSEESLDALLPHFASSDVGRKLDYLEQMRTHIARDGSPADGMLSDIEKQLELRRSDSPALDFSKQLGLGRPKTFWFRYDIGTEERSPNGYNPQFRCMISIDSRRQDWFHVSLYEVERHHRSAFGIGTDGPIDELQVGCCSPQQLPQWLAGVAPALGCTWATSNISGSLRGKKRAALVAWLESDFQTNPD